VDHSNDLGKPDITAATWITTAELRNRLRIPDPVDKRYRLGGCDAGVPKEWICAPSRHGLQACGPTAPCSHEAGQVSDGNWTERRHLAPLTTTWSYTTRQYGTNSDRRSRPGRTQPAISH